MTTLPPVYSAAASYAGADPSLTAAIGITKAGWLSRIMAAGGVTRQLALSTTTGGAVPAPPEASFRTCTPLRPAAHGIVERVATPLLAEASAARAAAAPSSRPQTVPSPVPNVGNLHGKSEPPSAPLSARAPGGVAKAGHRGIAPLFGGSGRGAAGQSAASTVNPLGLTNGMLGGTLTSSAFAPSSATNSLLDPFAGHEALLLQALNECRADPVAFAGIFESQMTVGQPFLPPDARPLSLASLKATIATWHQSIQDQQAKVDGFAMQLKKDLQSMKDAWAVDDAERLKKNKGKPAAAPAPGKAGKGGQAAAAGEKAPEDIDADREAQARLAQHRHEERCAPLLKEKARLTACITEAQRGVKALESCIARLRLCRPTAPLVHNRGLALAARDLCSNPPEPNRTERAVAEVAARYGASTAGSVGVAMVIQGADGRALVPRWSPLAASEELATNGERGGGKAASSQRGSHLPAAPAAASGARQTILDLLLCLDDPRKKGRLALLDDSFTVGAMGWRRHPTIPEAVCVTFLGAKRFAELSAIAEREHLCLGEVRRILPQATAITDGRIIALRPDWGVQMLDPVSSPAVSLDGRHVAKLRCDDNLTLCATVTTVSEPDPAKPVVVAGESLVQRGAEPETVEVAIAFRSTGRYKVHLFAKTEHMHSASQNTASSPSKSLNGTLASSQSMKPAQSITGGRVGSQPPSTTTAGADGAEGFVHLGFYLVDCRKYDLPRQALPVISSDFHERRCRLVSPLRELLTPDTEVDFHLVVPMHSYKQREVSRVEDGLHRTTAVAMGNKDAEAELTAACDRSSAALQEAKVTQAQHVTAVNAEIAAATKDLAKKKGKDLDRAKAAISELEERLAGYEAAVQHTKQAATVAQDRLAAHRRSTRQASAMRRRFLAEADYLRQLTDRSKPLHVELAVDDRRAVMPAVDDAFTTYRASLHMPVSPCRVCIFIAGVAVAYFRVGDPLEDP